MGWSIGRKRAHAVETVPAEIEDPMTAAYDRFVRAYVGLGEDVAEYDVLHARLSRSGKYLDLDEKGTVDEIKKGILDNHIYARLRHGSPTRQLEEIAEFKALAGAPLGAPVEGSYARRLCTVRYDLRDEYRRLPAFVTEAITEEQLEEYERWIRIARSSSSLQIYLRAHDRLEAGDIEGYDRLWKHDPVDADIYPITMAKRHHERGDRSYVDLLLAHTRETHEVRDSWRNLAYGPLVTWVSEWEDGAPSNPHKYSIHTRTNVIARRVVDSLLEPVEEQLSIIRSIVDDDIAHLLVMIDDTLAARSRMEVALYEIGRMIGFANEDADVAALDEDDDRRRAVLAAMYDVHRTE